jgi:hypothetical protein
MSQDSDLIKVRLGELKQALALMYEVKKALGAGSLTGGLSADKASRYHLTIDNAIEVLQGAIPLSDNLPTPEGRKENTIEPDAHSE